MTERVFLYGTLLDPELFEIVSGVPLVGQSAALLDMAVRRAAGGDYPVLIADEGTSASGLVVDVDEATRRRLDFYELGFGFRLETTSVDVEGTLTEALIYVPKSTESVQAEAWSLSNWDGPLARLAAAEYMALADTYEATEAARMFPQIRMRAASRLRAIAEPSPGTLAPRMDLATVQTDDTRVPYIDYFAVREDHLSFPRFSGGTSPTVKRATFMGGDAVTVLPFDPTTGTVMFVRQFRHGPYARGDTNPWTLEPAAGRIDPGEEPEDTARRELLEETGVDAKAVHFIGRYYPSPGAYSEYLYSYVAVADLGGRDGGVGGLEDEAEDIMAHVLSLDDAMAMIETGEVNTGPLILSLQWLAMHRDALT